MLPNYAPMFHNSSNAPMFHNSNNAPMFHSSNNAQPMIYKINNNTPNFHISNNSPPMFHNISNNNPKFHIRNNAPPMAMDHINNHAQMFQCISNDNNVEIYSRKVFLGGLPIDITEAEMMPMFQKFGTLKIEWHSRPTEKSNKISQINRRVTAGQVGMNNGYVLLVYDEERSVQRLMAACNRHGAAFYICLSSQTIRHKPVQVRPWLLSDGQYMPNPSSFLEPRWTIFIGALPRPTKAHELARALQFKFGQVCYVEIELDEGTNYPKGAARATFANFKSFLAAMADPFITVQNVNGPKCVDIKPYVIKEQMCDNCNGKFSDGQYAAYFCGDFSCLQYYCEFCWDYFHYWIYQDHKMALQRIQHKPFVRNGQHTGQLNYVPHHRQPAPQCCCCFA